MSVSSVASQSVFSTLTAAPSAAAAANARAVDGDYKTSGAGHRVKDADGDYKAAPKSGSPAAAPVASSTQAALTNLKPGG